MKILYNLHHAGALSDEEHPDWTQDQILEARADAAKDAWSTRLGQLDAEAIDLGWELVGRRIREAYDPEIKEYEKALDAVSKSGNQADAYDYYFGPGRKKDLTAAESAKNMLESSGWLLKRLAFMQDTLGEETPQEYTEMLGELGQIQDWIFGMRSLKATKDSHSGGGFIFPSTSDDEGAVAEWLENAKFTKIRREPEKEPTFIKRKVIGKATEESMQTRRPRYEPADEEEELSADALGIPKTPIKATVPVEVTPEYVPADEEEELSADALGIPQTPIETKIPVEIKADASSKQNAHAAGEQLADTAADGADGHQSEFADAGANAAKAFADALSSGSKTASAAGSALAFSAVTAVRTLLKIHSPSQVMLELGEYTAGGYTAGLNAGIPGVTATVSKLGAAVLDGMSLTAKEGESFAKGYMKGVLKAAEKTPVNKAKAPEEPAETPRPQNQTFTVSRQAEQPLLDNSDEHAAAFRRMMELVGASSVWYQDSLLDQALTELQNKYDQLLAAAKDGNEAYKNQLQESLKKETEAIKKEYQLQQQIALDFLDVREQALRKELSEKREKARTDDYEKELADLQRRLRQTKSAREKRELQEEIDAMIRDEELRQEENRLSDISAGFSVFRKAIRQGVIGLGDLLADPSFGAMSIGYGGIASIPDISAAQLEAALAAMGGGYTGGNTYQIDLTGATVRDEDDIQRIVDAFEDRMREIQRGL